MTKRFLALGAAVLAIAGGITVGLVGAETPLSVWLDNGNEVQFQSQPYIENGRTMVSAKDILEALNWGATTEIDDDTLSIYAGRFVIDFEPGSTEAVVYDYGTDELKTIELDTPATFDGTDYMVPLRALFEAFEIEVEWDGANNRIYVKTVPDELDMDYEEYSEEAVLDGLNVNEDDYEGFEDFDFSDAMYDDISEEEVQK
ncbi:MAG: hypothetical protein IJH36_05690 [Clostridia bacterium]|nr:hypothetical protein [Clostridia bacterium]